MIKYLLIAMNSLVFLVLTGCYVYDHNIYVGNHSFLFGTHLDSILKYQWICLFLILTPLLLLLPQVTRKWRIGIVYSMIPLTVWYWLLFNALSD